jgi:hypothetical protein
MVGAGGAHLQGRSAKGTGAAYKAPLLRQRRPLPAAQLQE